MWLVWTHHFNAKFNSEDETKSKQECNYKQFSQEEIPGKTIQIGKIFHGE